MFQESLRGEPFWMMVGCILLNRASWRQAGPAHAELKRRWPTARELALADVTDVCRVVHRVGFGSQRARRLVALAAAWVERAPNTAEDVLALPGCGKYASDSYAIFVKGRRDVEPTDGHLVAWLAENSS